MKELTLNLVWINAKPAPNPFWRSWRSQAPSQNQIPERYINCLKKAKSQAPEVRINIWMDICKKDDEDGSISRYFGQLSGLKDVHFFGLREIDRYRNNRLFQKKSKVSDSNTGIIWQQVDLARLLVLQYQMQFYSGKQIYSDFDISTFLLQSRVLDKIKESEFVFDSIEFCWIENRFLSLDPQSQDCMEFIEVTVEETENEYGKIFSYGNGWNTFTRNVRRARDKYLSDPEKQKKACLDIPSDKKDHSDYPGYGLR